MTSDTPEIFCARSEEEADGIDLGSTDGRNWYCPECNEPMLIPHAWDGSVYCLACDYDSADKPRSQP